MHQAASRSTPAFAPECRFGAYWWPPQTGVNTMKRIFTAAIAVATIALAGPVPVRATTFPVLTTIYFAAGVVDNSLSEEFGINTAIDCSNLSGQSANVQYMFRRKDGTIAGHILISLANLRAQTVTTTGNVDFLDEIELETGVLFGGTVQVQSTQSAVYCSAMLTNANGGETGPAGVALHMVRLNPHPGTVE
jgi:hypothetical protein